MKKIVLFVTFLFAILCTTHSQEGQPDYTQIKFKKKLKDYKKNNPKLEGLSLDKEYLLQIVDLLGEKFYNKEEREEIVEKIWLSFIDPKKFDMVHRDYAIRSLPNWDKKNFKGEIVLDPNIYLREWTNADSELDYFKIAMHRILMREGLMGYGEEAKDTRKSLKKMRYISKYTLPHPSSNDWTSSYLQKLGVAVKSKGLSVLITNNGGHEFVVCETSKKDTLIELLDKMRWHLVNPESGS